ncbi:MAG: OmpA family protein [Bacteroidota bacterium]
MKNYKVLFLCLPLLVLFSCVTKKKYYSLDSEYRKVQANNSNCNDQLKNAQALNTDLTNQNMLLSAQVDYLKKNSTEVLSALQDMSVLSSKQAESVKQSLENISQKDSYIRDLQSAISRKDSLNMRLVMNLKSNLSDVNDKDINIKVEKGVVYIDISDKMLFNTGKYAVTEKAKIILGKVATVLNSYPEIEFLVEGHTDSVPIQNTCMMDNWDLSVKRATSVVRILQKEYKMNPSRMTASGHSEYVPVASNDTEEGRALNRRTRIIILPQLDQFFKLLSTK